MAARLKPLHLLPTTTTSSCRCRLSPSNNGIHTSDSFRRALRRVWPRCGISHQANADPSSLASSTAIGATRSVPEGLQKLHHALVKVKRDAGIFVNYIKLELALRSLETQHPRIRLAVFGVGEQRSARRLARVLLADPLAPQEPWEDDLESERSDDGRALLIRYGASGSSYSTDHPLHDTLAILATRLQHYNLEILVSTIPKEVLHSVESPNRVGLDEMVLAPQLDASARTAGWTTTVIHPVHKAIVYVDSIRDCVALGRFTANSPAADGSGELIKMVLGLPARQGRIDADDPDQMAMVDVALASSALAKFRGSIENATAYEHDWFQSGMPALSSWFAQDLEARNQAMTPVVRRLVRSVLDEAEDRIDRDAAAKSEALAAATIPEGRRRAMSKSLSRWAEDAHTELRNELEAAFRGRAWNRLSWWRLLMHLEDVDRVASAILQRMWLVQAERRVIWLAGRLEGAGFLEYQEQPTPATLPTSVQPQLASLAGVISAAPSSVTIEPEADQGDESSVGTPPADPWPTEISLARHKLSMTKVPLLQGHGQDLTDSSTTAIGGSVLLSGLLHFAVDGITLFEAGAVGALGAVFSVWNLQGKWEAARKAWQDEIREEGRKALKETENRMAAIIEAGGRPTEDPEDVAARDAAREAVTSARQALQQVR